MAEIRTVPYTTVTVIGLLIATTAYILPNVAENARAFVTVEKVQRELIMLHAEVMANKVQSLNASLEILDRQRFNMKLIKSPTDGVEAQLLRMAAERDHWLRLLTALEERNPDLHLVP